MRSRIQDNKNRPWFAWFPVSVYDWQADGRRTVWLETVSRAEVGYYWDRYYVYSINFEKYQERLND